MLEFKAALLTILIIFNFYIIYPDSIITFYGYYSQSFKSYSNYFLSPLNCSSE